MTESDFFLCNLPLNGNDVECFVVSERQTASSTGFLCCENVKRRGKVQRGKISEWENLSSFALNDSFITREFPIESAIKMSKLYAFIVGCRRGNEFEKIEKFCVFFLPQENFHMWKITLIPSYFSCLENASKNVVEAEARNENAVEKGKNFIN